jgi:hypothetical protein
MTPGSTRARMPWAHAWLLLLPVLAAFTSGWVGVTRDGGSMLEGTARFLASGLLMVVGAAVAHVVHDRRDAGRHASIQADIAAGGGLNRRLMV